MNESVRVSGRHMSQLGRAWFARKRGKAAEPISWWLMLGFKNLGFGWINCLLGFGGNWGRGLDS